MNLPLFFYEDAVFDNGYAVLNEESSRHIVQVLRMKAGEQVQLTDGKGSLWTTRIEEDHKKKTVVKLESNTLQPPPAYETAIAISLIKNSSRFEWFLEKATEIGINTIIPMLCERTEKQHFRQERMKSIVVSALLQSRQVWLPVLTEPQYFNRIIQQSRYTRKFIAHCEEDNRNELSSVVNGPASALLLIGPEGDFTREEIALALANDYMPVSLGATRLRTETAGIAGATLLRLAGTR